MLYLVIGQDDIPVQKWSTDPATDFASAKSYGPAMVDADGKPIDSAILEVKDGAVVISKTKEDALKAAALAEKAKLDARAARIAAAKALLGRSLTAAEIKQAVEFMLAEILDGR